MNKKISKIKRFLSFALIFLFSINSFATSVNNNDGSAFISKAEFDTLKSSFQSQIDTYNQSIDSKIDEAIASYLGNIDIAGDVIDYVEKINNQTGNKFKFINAIPGIGISTVTTDCNITINFDIYKKVPVVYARVRARNVKGPGIFFDVAATLARYNNHDTNDDLFAAGTTTKQSRLPNAFNYKDWVDIDKLEHSFNNLASSEMTSISTGKGAVWEYYRKPDGKIKLSSYNSDFYPIQNIMVNNHQYAEYWTKHAGATNAEKDALFTYLTSPTGADLGIDETVTVTKNTKWGTTGGGSVKDPTDTDSGSWWSMELSKMQSKDTADWEVLQIGSDLSKTKVYCIDQNKELTAGSVTSKVLNVTYPEQYYPSTGIATRTVKVGKITGQYYPVFYDTEYIGLNNFINDIVSSIANEDVYLGGGAPMCKVPKAKKVKFDLEFALENASGTATNGTVYVKISDKQFKDGDFATGAKNHISLSEYISTATDGGKKSYTFECKENEIIWFNIEPATVGDSAWLKSATYTYVN